MTSPNLRVAVILDPRVGEEINRLAASAPVWVCDSPDNRAAAEKLWRDAGLPPDHVTVFTAIGSGASALLDVLETVHQHHPGWLQLQVIGCKADKELLAALAGYGKGSVEETPNGFVYRRS